MHPTARPGPAGVNGSLQESFLLGKAAGGPQIPRPAGWPNCGPKEMKKIRHEGIAPQG